MKKTLCILAALTVAACASSPDDMTASYVSPLQYQDYSCKQLGAESAIVERRVSELYGSLDKKASNDNAQMAAGLLLLWPTLFFLEGGDGGDASEYRRLKGEYDALEKASIRKNCGIRFNIQEVVPKKVKPKKPSEVDKRLGGK